MTEPTDFERAALASLQRELETMQARAAGRLRAENALHMSAQQWSLIYGAPIPGASRTLAEVASANQLNAQGTAWGGGFDGTSEVAFSDRDEARWR
jgi:hypothetical protein